MSPRKMIAAMVLALAAGLARGQAVAVDPNLQNPDDASLNSGQVFVNKSTLAIDQINLAQRLAVEKDWAKSAEVYQGVIEKYHDRVVPSHADADNVVDRYTSVLTLVNEQLESWPPEGLAAYRTKYELQAKALVDSARDNDLGEDLGPLHEAFTKYFATDAGKLAGLKLIDAYFELGEFSAASWTAQELLHHPDIDADRAGVLFRAGLAAHLSGDETAAQAALSELNDKFANSPGTVGGRDVTLAAELKSDMARSAGVAASNATSAGADSWPIFGGDGSRGKSFVSGAQPQAKLYTVDLPQPNWNVITKQADRRTAQEQDYSYRSRGRAMGVMPVADRGELFFQVGGSVYGRDLETGAPLPGWLATYPQTGGSFVLAKSWNLPKGQQFCLTVTDRSVMGVMNLPDPYDSTDGPTMSLHPTLVCLDRESGQMRWKVTPADLADPTLQKLTLCGSALVVGSNAYVAAVQSKGDGFVDCYILCFDSRNGTLRWSCYVVNALRTGEYTKSETMQLDPLLPDPTHLAYASGRIYIATNLGAVAAVDAYSGVIHWLDIYRQAADVPTQMYQMGMGGRRFGFGFGGGMNPALQQQQNKTAQDALDALPPPWVDNAPIIRDGNVFVLPTDGSSILVLDAGDGRLVQRLAKDNCCRLPTDVALDSEGKPQTLLGVLPGTMINDNNKDRRADLLIVGTPTRVFAIKWKEYSDVNAPAAVAWASVHLAGDSIRARPFVTADSVFIPTSSALNRLDVRNGLTKQMYPAGGGWPDGEDAGNPIVCGDEVVVAGDQSVRAYTSLAIAESRLDKEITAAASDPTPRLHYAEVMFLANQPEQAVKRLDEALALLKAAPAGQNADAQERAFNDAIRFAQQSWQKPAVAREAGEANQAMDIDALFDRAQQLAQWPSQKACYLLERAQYVRDRVGDISAALKLYQAVLADHSLRIAVPFTNEAPMITLPPPDAGGDFTGATESSMPINPASITDKAGQAGKLAEDAIKDLLSDAKGHLAYGPFQQAAERELSAATAAKDPARIAEVAEAYPNALSVSRQALHAAAELAERKSDYSFAIWALRDLYPRLDDDNTQKVAVLEEMSQDYLRVPGLQGGPAFRFEAAAGRMSLASRLDPAGIMKQPLVVPGGKVLARLPLGTAMTALDKLMDDPSPGRDDMPEIGLPTHAEVLAYLDKNKKMPLPLVPQEQMAAIPNVDRLLTMDQPVSRYDRVVTWTHGAGLSVYPLARVQPLGTCAEIGEEPVGAAWVKQRSSLLVWTATGLTLVDGEKVTLRWRVDTASLAPTGVLLHVAVTPAYLLLRPTGSTYPGRGGRGRMGLNYIPDEDVFTRQPIDAISGSLPDETDLAADENREAITDVTPLSEVAIVSTSSGRVAAVDLASGEMRWQCRPVNRAADRVLANDDFTVVSSKSEGGTQLAVFDTRGGKMLAWALFRDNPPINLALGDDGTLAWSQMDHVTICDLHQLGGDLNLAPTVESTRLPMQLSPFASMSRPGQLVVHGREVLAVSQGGDIRRYAVESGQSSELPSFLFNGDDRGQATLKIGGGYLYAYGPASVFAFKLDNPAISPIQSRAQAAGSAQLFIGKDFLLYFRRNEAAATSPVWMNAYSRAMTPGGESGLQYFSMKTLTPEPIVTAWQVVQGGVYYLTTDHSLYMLRGNSKP